MSIPALQPTPARCAGWIHEVAEAGAAELSVMRLGPSWFTMQFAFVCRTCGCDLTDFLSDEDQSSLAPGNIRGAMIEPGRFVRITQSIPKQQFFGMTFGSAEEGATAIVRPGDFIVNVADLGHQMQSRAKFGCCGYQGGTEANALCSNGHPVATIHSDCWHAAFARLIGESVDSVAV